MKKRTSFTPFEPDYPPMRLSGGATIICTGCGWSKDFLHETLLSTVLVAEVRHQMQTHKEGQ